MKIVYATGQPRHFEFAIVSDRIHIPKEATIPAVIDGERTDNQLDEHVFNAIDDQEYYELQKLIHKAQLSECKPNEHVRSNALRVLLAAIRRGIARFR